MIENNTIRVSIDIETLGPEPDGALLSIGAVAFADGEILDRFYLEVDSDSAEAIGMSVDEDTKEWWEDQDEDAREVLEGGNPIVNVLRNFAVWYPEDAEEVWAYPPHFDIQILETAFDLVGEDAPWGRWDKKDVGSVKELPGAPEVEQEGTQHNAVDDAEFQARMIIETMNKLQRCE